MKSTLTALLFCMLISSVNGQVKMVTPGEHLIYTCESFNNVNEPFPMVISPGDTWTAFYIENGYYKTRTEIVSWDTTKALQIMSDTIKQPKFYVQGLPNFAASGPGTEFSTKDFYSFRPLIWTQDEHTYTLLYSHDVNCRKLASKKYGQIASEKELIIFKDVNKGSVTGLVLTENETVVKLHWTADINGDNEPDFLLQVPSHHETIILELIVSERNGSRTKWRRVARFTESS